MKNDSGGIINIYKPVGMTSFGVVARVRRLLNVKKVGHCGTLDPFAQGVLPICIGRSTAAVQYMDQYDKRYRVEMVFGSQTDTQDRTGEVISTYDITLEDLTNLKNSDFASLKSAIKQFVGTQEQLPPMYSAIKVNGRPLYEYARKGIEIERKKRSITVYEATLIDASIENNLRATIDIHCSKGTYIRTICVDLGQIMNYGAYADSLYRTACGPFNIEDTISLEALEQLLSDVPENRLQFLREKNICKSVEFALSYMDKIVLNKSQVLRIIQGQKVNIESDILIEKPILTFSEDYIFIGITSFINDSSYGKILKAERVFVDVEDFT